VLLVAATTGLGAELCVLQTEQCVYSKDVLCQQLGRVGGSEGVATLILNGAG
jgi:late competence protein required for DNA uptake (superfamily II DNA/RNA helicase)